MEGELITVETAPGNFRKMRGFGGDRKREDVTGLAVSADGMKIYWSLAVNSRFLRCMSPVHIM